MLDIRKKKFGTTVLEGSTLFPLEYWCHQCSQLRLHMNGGIPERCQNCGSGNIVVDDLNSPELDGLRVAARKMRALPEVIHVKDNDVMGLVWNERRKKGEALAAVLKPGDRVMMPHAEWSPIRAGICEEKDEIGFKVGGLWFGWHELDSIVAP